MAQKCNVPPIPQSLTVTSTMKELPDGTTFPKYLQFVKMLGVDEFNGENWQSYIGKKAGPRGSKYIDVGYYTVGLSTCVGIGMVFTANDAAGDAQCQVSLAHLSNQVAGDKTMLTEITRYMIENNFQDFAARFVVAYEEGNPHMPQIWQVITTVFAQCGIPIESDSVVLLQEIYPMMPARMAVNFNPQIGTW